MREFEEIFPLIKEIKNEEIRAKVSRCWKLAMEKGKWDSLDGIPFTLLIPNAGSFVEHVNRVAEMAFAIGKKRGDVDMDALLAGALLHDVGKLLEYEKVGKKIRKSSLGKIIRHPISGASLAMEVGLDERIVSIISSHSKEGEFVERIPEAIIVHHCDFIDFEIAKGKK
ncbi:MAG: HD domain-containing protein [Thermoplasmata archaeon]|nr:MAG: HD domain-containing protein [Thermoplasmata archaeon]